VIKKTKPVQKPNFLEKFEKQDLSENSIKSNVNFMKRRKSSSDDERTKKEITEKALFF